MAGVLLALARVAYGTRARFSIQIGTHLLLAHCLCIAILIIMFFGAGRSPLGFPFGPPLLSGTLPRRRTTYSDETVPFILSRFMIQTLYHVVTCICTLMITVYSSPPVGVACKV